MKIYVVSSWRSLIHPSLVTALKAEGHDVYDYRNPPHGITLREEFSEPCDLSGMAAAFDSPRVTTVLHADVAAIKDCDVFVAVLPGGNGTHLELGFALGLGKPACMLFEAPVRPELLYYAGAVPTVDTLDVLSWVSALGGVKALGEKYRAEEASEPPELLYCEIVAIPPAEGGGFCARVPALGRKTARADGSTPEKALQALRDALTPDEPMGALFVLNSPEGKVWRQAIEASLKAAPPDEDCEHFALDSGFRDCGGDGWYGCKECGRFLPDEGSAPDEEQRAKVEALFTEVPSPPTLEEKLLELVDRWESKIPQQAATIDEAAELGGRMACAKELRRVLKGEEL